MFLVIVKRKIKRMNPLVFSEDFAKNPFEQRFRRLARSDLPTGVYNGTFVEQRWFESRRIGSVKGYEQW